MIITSNNNIASLVCRYDSQVDNTSRHSASLVALVSRALCRVRCETDGAPAARRAFNTPNRPLREASADDQSRRDFESPRERSRRFHRRDAGRDKEHARARRARGRETERERENVGEGAGRVSHVLRRFTELLLAQRESRFVSQLMAHR